MDTPIFRNLTVEEVNEMATVVPPPSGQANSPEFREFVARAVRDWAIWRGHTTHTIMVSLSPNTEYHLLIWVVVEIKEKNA